MGIMGYMLNMTTPIEQLARALADVCAPNLDPQYVVTPSRYVRIALASARTGFSVKAIQRKIEDGVWVEGREWVRAPDNCILIDMEGYEAWVKGRRV